MIVVVVLYIGIIVVNTLLGLHIDKLRARIERLERFVKLYKESDA